MAALLKKYRVKEGHQHYVANPNFDIDKDVPEDSHKVAKGGDVVELTDEQFSSFKDKFEPVTTAAANVKEADAKVLETAKIEAAKTGQMVNPNK